MKTESRSSGRRNLNATVAKMHAVYGKRLKPEDYSALLVETTETDPAFAASLRTESAYAQMQAEIAENAVT